MAAYMCILTPEGLRQEDHGLEASLKNTERLTQTNKPRKRKIRKDLKGVALNLHLGNEAAETG